MKFDVSKWFSKIKQPRKLPKALPKKLPKWLIPTVAAVAAAAVGVGIFAVQKNKSQGKTVYVYGIDIAGMTDYWGDSQQTSGSWSWSFSCSTFSRFFSKARSDRVES